MPIKCAGAPQKALYLSADYWLKSSRLDNIDIEFYNSGVVLFGGAVQEPDPQDPRDAYWQKRFLTDRRLSADALDAQQVRAIRERYYMVDAFTRQLQPNHVPVLFVRFGCEFNEIRNHRDQLQASFVGRMEVWEFHATHYFSTTDHAPLRMVVGDVAVTRRLAERFRGLTFAGRPQPTTLPITVPAATTQPVNAPRP